ncbi:hypothetical protein ACWIUD_04805 [Helicobacter sp. 23-1044]
MRRFCDFAKISTHPTPTPPLRKGVGNLRESSAMEGDFHLFLKDSAIRKIVAI